MKNQALFSSLDKSKKIKCRLLHFFSGTLRVNDNVFVSTVSLEDSLTSDFGKQKMLLNRPRVCVQWLLRGWGRR